MSKKNVKCRCIDEKKSKCFCEKKKNLSVRRKIFKVWRGGKMFKYRISGVRKKKELKEEFREKKKNQSIFGWKFKVWDFAKFIFTGWAFMLICKLKLQRKLAKIFKVFFGAVWSERLLENFEVKKKLFGSWVTPLVGRHVVNELKVA